MKNEFPNIGSDCPNYKFNEKLPSAIERLLNECGMQVYGEGEARPIHEMLDAATKYVRGLNSENDRIMGGIMESKNIEQAAEASIEHFKRMEDAVKNITVKGDFIIINEPNSFQYEIPLSECRTVRGAIGWLKHMAEKTWVTEEKLWCIADLIVDDGADSDNGL